jgi:hypothetical protein
MPLDGMEPGFWNLGCREGSAVLIAVVIIVDWAVIRYLQRGRPAARDVTKG